MATKTKSQISMDDRIVANPALLDLLEQRETAKEALAETKEVRKAFKVKDDACKAAIKAIEEIPPYRIGRFVITKKDRAARTVEFEIEASVVVKISNADAKE